MTVKNMNTIAGPTNENKKGINEGIMAANIQCVELPKVCPQDLTLIGNISDIKTHITAPWPMACAAINKKKNTGTSCIFQLNKNEIETKLSETM